VEKADLATALNYANQAIELDKNYAPAWALRSYVLNWMAGYDLMDQREGYPRARVDAQQAIALDPNLAAGYLALGWVQMKQDWDWKSTEASRSTISCHFPTISGGTCMTGLDMLNTVAETEQSRF
jgi:tetratricopeptide (TPR) repeat protein